MLKFVDDGKEKYQSHEAHVGLSDSKAMHHFSLDATGYGANREEALANLNAALAEIKAIIDEEYHA